MSLINDALKKAARQRSEELAENAAPMPGGGRGRASRHGDPMQKQTMLLVGAAAVALVTVSVVITGILMTGRTEPKAVAAANPPPETPAPKFSPVVAVEAPPLTVSLPKAATPPPTPAAILLPTAAPTPSPASVVAVKIEPAPASLAPVAPPLSHAEQVQAAIEKLHVSGVRAAETGSKALIDGHVYRENDLVDRALGLRLTKVDEDHLTFVDRNGDTYIKSF